MAWISEYRRWLSESESLNNAKEVAKVLQPLGWTREAVSALCGNMRHESSINPDMYEYGYDWNADRGFGLVQWTPRSKLSNWCDARGLDFRKGDAQMQRINYEVTQNIQWIPVAPYNKTFNQFIKSKEDVGYLTEMFCWSYERPLQSAGIESMPERKAFAMKVFNMLGDTPNDGVQRAILPIDIINIIQGEYGEYSHYVGSGNEWGMDFVVPGQTRYPLTAPCDAVVIDVDHNYAQVSWATQNPVLCADGQIRSFWFRIVHDDNYSRWKVGDTIKQGEHIGNTGNSGMSSGDHLHLDCFKGTTYDWTAYGDTSKMLHNYDIFFIMESTTIINDYGYNWILTSDVPIPPGEDGGNKNTDDIIHLLLCGALNGW